MTIPARAFLSFRKRNETAGFQLRKLSAQSVRGECDSAAATHRGTSRRSPDGHLERLQSSARRLDETKPLHEAEAYRARAVEPACVAASSLDEREKWRKRISLPWRYRRKTASRNQASMVGSLQAGEFEERQVARSATHVRQSSGLVRHVAPNRWTPAWAHAAPDHGALCAPCRRSVASGNESLRFNCGCRPIPQAGRRCSAASRPGRVMDRPRVDAPVSYDRPVVQGVHRTRSTRSRIRGGRRPFARIRRAAGLLENDASAR
jgi:hypothetical protein